MDLSICRVGTVTVAQMFPKHSLQTVTVHLYKYNVVTKIDAHITITKTAIIYHTQLTQNYTSTRHVLTKTYAHLRCTSKQLLIKDKKLHFSQLFITKNYATI